MLFKQQNSSCFSFEWNGVIQEKGFPSKVDEDWSIGKKDNLKKQEQLKDWAGEDIAFLEEGKREF